LLHDRGELTGDLVLVELLGSLRGAVSFLENTLTLGARLVPVIVALPRRHESSDRYIQNCHRLSFPTMIAMGVLR
jgi:hypothetical protein